MEMPVASYTQQKNVGIQEILSMCTLDFNTVLVACLGTTDLFLLNIDNSMIEISQIFSLDLNQTAGKLRYTSIINTVFILSDNTLYSVVIKKTIVNSLNGLRRITEENSIIDFDAVIRKEGIFISILEELEISILVYTKDDIFPLSRFYTGNTLSCNWVTPDCLCCKGQNILNFYAMEGSFMLSLGSNIKTAIYATPLLECFYYDKSSSIYSKENKFIVLFGKSGIYFSQQLVLYSQISDDIKEIAKFPIFSTSLPTCIFSLGPWICVGGSFGLEFYDYRTGTYAQSILENVSTLSYSLANVCLDSTLIPNDLLYSRARYGIAITNNTLYSLCFYSILDIVEELKNDAAFNADLLDSLCYFGISVKTKKTMRSFPKIDTILSSNMLFSEYGSILAKFHIPQSGLSTRISSFSENIKKNISCTICGIEYLFSSNFNHCSLCFLIICKKCSFTRNLKLYGYDSMNTNSIICSHCDGGCDLNLYRLFLARRYTQILYYIQHYPERCYKLSLTEVIPSVLQQCFKERKYELCAEILENYVPKDSIMWDQWVVQFGLKKQIRCLASVHNPNFSDKTVNTGILLQLVKYDVNILYELLQRWPKISYNNEMVLIGIESRLSFKKKESYNFQKSCQITKLTLSEFQNALSSVYFDEEINNLLRAYLHLTFENKKYMDAARVYMEYFIMMLPYQENQRKRSFEMFEGKILNINYLYKFPPQDLIDFWDLITSYNILEDFVRLKDSSGTTVFLTPLLIHYREELGRYLIDSLDKDLLHDILESIVIELKDEQPAQLLQVLDALTKVSPVTTLNYHSLMSKLYLEYAPENFFNFIQHPQVSGLNWKQLARIVEKRKMFRELIYIVGKTGNGLEAVRMAIRCMKNVSLALEYIKDHPDDKRLWNIFVENVIQSPKLIGDFLDAADDFVDTGFLLKFIPTPNRLDISLIGPRLKKVLKNKWSIERITESSLDSISEDNYTSLNYLRKGICKGALCIPNSLCNSCGQIILGEYIVDNSGESFHTGCIHNFSLKLPVFKKRKHINNDSIIIEKNYEMDYIQYLTNKSLGVTDLIKLLPERQLHYIFTFLSPNDREICRRVSRSFRKVIGSFYIFVKREDDNLRSRYNARLEETKGKNCLQTIHLGKIPVFNSLKNLALLY